MLRSQFKYKVEDEDNNRCLTDKSYPRSITLDYTYYTKPPGFKYSSVHCHIDFFGIIFKSDNIECKMHEYESVDIIGNELVGGKMHKQNDGEYQFKLMQVEAYQIL